MFPKMMRSLTARVTALTIGGTSIAFISFAIGVFWVFENSLDSQLDNHLTAFNDLLAGAIHMEDGELIVDNNNTLLRSIPRHWQIDLPNGKIIKSGLLEKPFTIQSFPEITRFSHLNGDGETIIAHQQYFDFPQGNRIRITFGLEQKIAEKYKADLREQFSKHVYGVLVFVSIILITIGWVIIALVTRPLNQASSSLKRVQEGEATRIEGKFPVEISNLTDQVNNLLDYTAATIERHRTFSGNVAHALKTPLTVIRNETKSDLIKERADAMLQVIDRNLARVHTAGSKNILSNKTPIKPIAQRISDGFSKVYQKVIEIDCDDQALFFGDEADLYEVLGNLIENACKFGKSKVLIKINEHSIIIEDDGPGIQPTEYDKILARGIRLDQTKPGIGIGLAVTRDVVELCNGSLDLDKSELGGLKVTIELKK